MLHVVVRCAAFLALRFLQGTAPAVIGFFCSHFREIFFSLFARCLGGEVSWEGQEATHAISARASRGWATRDVGRCLIQKQVRT